MSTKEIELNKILKSNKSYKELILNIKLKYKGTKK